MSFVVDWDRNAGLTSVFIRLVTAAGEDLLVGTGWSGRDTSTIIGAGESWVAIYPGSVFLKEDDMTRKHRKYKITRLTRRRKGSQGARRGDLREETKPTSRTTSLPAWSESMDGMSQRHIELGTHVAPNKSVREERSGRGRRQDKEYEAVGRKGYSSVETVISVMWW